MRISEMLGIANFEADEGILSFLICWLVLHCFGDGEVGRCLLSIHILGHISFFICTQNMQISLSCYYAKQCFDIRYWLMYREIQSTSIEKCYQHEFDRTSSLYV